MTQIYASVAIGTAAALMVILLLLLRAEVHGRRPVLALMRRWVAAGPRASGLALSLLSAIAIGSFALMPGQDRAQSGGLVASMSSEGGPSQQGAAVHADAASSGDEALDALRAYAGGLEAKTQTVADKPPASEPAALPGVDTMIAQLVARLEKQPDDVKGWKMLGWSYLNTGNPKEAEKAYETALKLAPSDTEITKGLEAAKAAQSTTTGTVPPDAAAKPAGGEGKGADGKPDLQQDSMIRGMVDRLAARLETSPNDEEGWMRLMRSRMTLGEKDAAKAALAKALNAFASDDAAKARLTAAARELGVEK